MTIEQILDYKLKKLIGEEKFSTVTQDDKNFILAQAKNKIQNYCHRVDIPTAAYYVWADMAIEMLKDLDGSLFISQEEADLMERVTSVKAGDTTISFESGSGENDSNKVEADSVLSKFSTQLQSFRKFPKGCGCDVI